MIPESDVSCAGTGVVAPLRSPENVSIMVGACLTLAAENTKSDPGGQRRPTAEELATALKKHEQWVNSAGAAGDRIDLSGADLRKRDLSDANLPMANLSETDSTEIDLTTANLWEASLSEAILVEADLSGAVLWAADLSGADLRGADLSMAVLWETDLSGARLRQATLTKANLHEADLTGTSVRAAKLCFADTLSGAVLDDELRERIEERCPGKLAGPEMSR